MNCHLGNHGNFLIFYIQSNLHKKICQKSTVFKIIIVLPKFSTVTKIQYALISEQMYFIGQALNFICFQLLNLVLSDSVVYSAHFLSAISHIFVQLEKNCCAAQEENDEMVVFYRALATLATPGGENMQHKNKWLIVSLSQVSTVVANIILGFLVRYS